MAAKPATPSGVMAASAPPQIIASAYPPWISRNASPTACAPVVQAVATAEFGPFAPRRTDTKPAARLMMDDRMKNGETRSGPRSSRMRCSRSITSNPPIPLPMTTPTRVAFAGSIRSPL